MTLTLPNARMAAAPVAGIFDDYIGRAMLMSRACYREVFGEECVDNAFYIRLNGADEGALIESLGEIEGYENYTRADSDKALFLSGASLVVALVVMLNFMAAVMAGVVLTNLTNIHIMEKKPELTIMRINGFTTRQAVGYVLRETVVTTLAGIALGIAAGSGVAYGIVRALETAFVQYDRDVSPRAWLCGAGITLFYAVLINAVELRKVRHLKLTDAAG